jgi:hypothetical protein
MLPGVFQVLMASVAVRNFVVTTGTTPRIFRAGDAPQDVTRPYITWQLVSGTPENNLSELPPFDRQSVQVDCWHPADRSIDDMASAVRDAIEPVAHMTSVLLNNRDPETRLYRIAMQFDFFNGRN